MFELRQRVRFPLEPRQPFGIGAQLRGQDLDGDVAVQPIVLRAKHLSHSAFTDLAGDAIAPEARPTFHTTSFRGALPNVVPVNRRMAGCYHRGLWDGAGRRAESGV
jgi:hypothetical protein